MSDAQAPNADGPLTEYPGTEIFRLDGRVAVVTGGARGLGAAMAQGLVRAGARVAILDLDGLTAATTARQLNDVLGEERWPRAVGFALDVTDETAVDRAFESVVEALGEPEILINSAGISARGAAIDYDPARFENVLRVNVVGSFLCCRAAARTMIPAGRGSIINIASIAGMVGYGGNPAYLTSKGGVVQLTRALAMEWAGTGIRVNAIAPCVIETDSLLAQVAREPEFYVEFRRRHPIGRFGRIDEIVGPALFLASDAASLITGVTLPVDGGYTAQ